MSYKMRLRYLKLAKEKLIENVGKSHGSDSQVFMLQQNNAVCHTCVQTIKFFTSSGILINEHVWQYLKSMIGKHSPNKKQQIIARALRYVRGFHPR